jgi:hypothetical protein
MARKTWRYFEEYVTEKSHWLPPDNVQYNGQEVIAARTSPTNIAMGLLSDLAACDFGYCSVGRLIARTERTFATLATLERHRGHFLNWYDTRTLQPGALYVALRGERFDGHDFAQAAVERGAAAVLGERAVDIGAPQIIAADSRRALGVGAAQWRARFTLPVIAVTGSNGKTTVTQMIAAILAQAHGEKQRLARLRELQKQRREQKDEQ